MNYIINIFEYLMYGLLIVYVFKIILSSIQNYHSRWSTLIDNFNFSSQEFYLRLQAELNSKDVRGVHFKQVELAEGGVFSPKRRYLRIIWKDYQYDICAAPFGKGFFISWWMYKSVSDGELCAEKFPLIGNWMARTFFPETPYKIDTASMFMSYAQSSVLKVIDDITKEKGIRALSESERKPVLMDIFKR